jgi:2,5-diamino-6-(ribosylamino)-4(3H)-pyrimidinone 5'-phosphate reductase
MSRPYVLINVAATLDGKIDTHDRQGARISSERDLERVDRLRASVDGIMVGGRTLHDEDPRLTIRSPELRASRVARGEPEQPARIGVTTRPAVPPDARFVTGSPGRVILLVPHDVAHQPAPKGVEVYPVGDGQVDLCLAMATLAGLGLRRLMVEGGGSLNFELLRLGLVDEVQVYIAPLVFGGAGAPTLADGAGLGREAAVRLGPPSVEDWQDGGVLLRYMVEPS